MERDYRGESYQSQEAKLEELRNKIQNMRDQIDQNQIKTTLKKVAEKSDSFQQISNFSLTVKKTINNREDKKQTKKSNESETNTPINCITFNQNEKFQNQFATVDESGRLALWDSKKGQQIVEEPKVTNGLLMTCAFENREGKLLACGGIDTKLHIYSINPSGKKKEKLNLIEKVMEFTGHYGLITCCGFLSNNYLISGSNDSSIMLWDFEKPGRFLVKYSDHQNEVLALDVFNLDGNIIATGSNDATTRLWDIRMKNACFRVFEKNQCGISAVKFMTDSVNTLAVGCDDSSIKLYDLRAVGKVGKYKEEQGFESVQSLAFSNSGRFLFSSYFNNKIKVWDTLTEQKVTQITGPHKDAIKSVAMSYDGSSLVSAGKDGIITVWQ